LRDDRGSAAVWLLTLAMVMWSSMTAVVLVGTAIAGRHRASSAADLAALAAAAVEGRAALFTEAPGSGGGPSSQPDPQAPSGCAVAAAIAVANEASLVQCHVDGLVVEITASVQLRGLGHLALGSVSAKARAGPS
jgi:hypothetical protein